MRKLVPVLVGLLLLAGCGDDDDGGNGGDVTEVNGIVTTSDGSATGSLFLEIDAAALLRAARTASTGLAASRSPVPAVGDVTLFGSTSDLEGTYDPETGELAVSGGGYNFGGLYEGVTLNGTWTGPGGSNGTFVSAPGDGGAAYCGTFVSNDGLVDGTFSFVTVGEVAYGEAYSDGDVLELNGELSGPVPATGFVNVAFLYPGTSIFFANGQVAAGSTSGSFNVPDSFSGTWTGAPSFCSGQT